MSRLDRESTSRFGSLGSARLKIERTDCRSARLDPGDDSSRLRRSTAELGSFDLVVIDEASQSDITALPAILRGKKVLIVGNDKQVSRTPIGIEDRKVLQLRTTFLSRIPFADQMDPATSLYQLASMVYPGRAIVLREHFRCVEPIISFSSRFYPKPLIPLRMPAAS